MVGGEGEGDGLVVVFVGVVVHPVDAWAGFAESDVGELVEELLDLGEYESVFSEEEADQLRSSVTYAAGPRRSHLRCDNAVVHKLCIIGCGLQSSRGSDAKLSQERTAGLNGRFYSAGSDHSFSGGRAMRTVSPTTWPVASSTGIVASRSTPAAESCIRMWVPRNSAAMTLPRNEFA